MAATSLQFGPEWMRTKQQTTPSATRPPNPSLSTASRSPGPPAPPGASSYSSLLTPPAPAPPEKQVSDNPFMYSKEEMLQIWKDGGGRGGLGLEVELWEGVVKEIGGTPFGLREVSEAERKLFSLPLNSDLRRRQSHDFLPTLSLPTGDRSKLPHSGSSTHSPIAQQRFGPLGGRRRKDEDSTQPLAGPRRLSLTSVSSPLGGPLSPTAGAMPSARAKFGSGSHGPDAVSNTGDGSWRKRDTDTTRSVGHAGGSHDFDERDEETQGEGTKQSSRDDPNFNGPSKDPSLSQSDSDRSIAPSPPSAQGESAQEAVEGLSVNTGVTLPEEQRNASRTTSILNPSVEGSGVPAINGISAARPPGLEEDPANISWSYRDPKGNIQGPFAASLMQKWYDDGYFTPDLLMKRTHVDTDWVPVGELCRRAGNEKLFFSSFADHGPPGLTPRPAVSPVDGQSFDRFGPGVQTIPPQHPSAEFSAHDSPLRPFRNSSVSRTSALDPYLGTTSSNTNTSDSPVSILSAPIIPIPSASPDLPFGVSGGRPAFGNNALEPAFGGRVGAFDSQPSSLGARGVGTMFNSTNNPSYGPRLASLGHRGAVFDTQGFANVSNSGSSVSPWTAGVVGSVSRNPDTPGMNNPPSHRASLNNGAFSHSPTLAVPGFNDMGSNDSPIFGSDAYNYANNGFAQLGRPPSTEALSSSFGPIGPGLGLRDQGLRPQLEMEDVALSNRHGLDEPPRDHTSFINGHGPTSPVGPGRGDGFGMTGNETSQQHDQHLDQQIPTISAFSQSPVPASSLNPLQPQHSQQQTVGTLAQSPWSTTEASAQPRPRPYDTLHSTAANVVGIIPNDPSSNNRRQTPDWYNVPKLEHDDGWGDTLATQASTNNHNIDTNQEQQSGWYSSSQISSTSFDHVAEQAQVSHLNSAPPAAQPVQPQGRDSTSQRAIKKRGSVPIPQVPQSISKSPVTLGPATDPPSPLPPAATQTKPAWSTNTIGGEDDLKPTKQAGLREIQEAEAKRAEAKRIADRERDRATRAQPQEETQTYTASWGLPTSQAGNARTTPKEQAAAITSPAIPVWTNAGKPPPQTKRTMKEIQEEEERRKKTAKDKETASVTARRGYAESANKTLSGAPGAPPGGAWTTVGASGKSNPSSAARHVSSGGQPASPSPAILRSSNGTSAVRTPSTSPQNTKASPSKPAPADDSPVPPSPEFMKWLREAVRGFNPGFNTEEFMAMLLTFSLDFPPSTVEVIQDMVYMNSATLDGRRFAADFCSRRKADAANRPKGSGASAGGKTPSLADVVKTQPKPAQAEFGFKVVKKKGRGNSLR